MSEQDGKIVNLGGLKKFKEYYDTDIITPINNKINSKTNVQSGEIITTNNDTIGYFKNVKINGNTRYKKSDGTYTDTWESGVSLESMGEAEKNSDGKYPVEVVSCGKNLFSTKLLRKINSKENCNLCSWNEDTEVLHLQWNGKETYPNLLSPKVKKNTQYAFSFEIQSTTNTAPILLRIKYTDGSDGYSTDKLTTSTEYQRVTIVSELNKTISYIFWVGHGNTIMNVRNLQIEEGTTATNYEPYKEDKRAVLLDSPLRKNDVLDLEKLKITRNYGSETFNGSDSENWELGVSHTNSIVFYKGLSGSLKYTQSTNGSLLCDKFIYNWNIWSSDEEGVRIEEYGVLQVSILKSKLETQDVAGFKTWLQSNPVTIVYELATPTTEDIEVSSNTLTDFTTSCTLTIDNTIKGNIECNEVVGLIPSVEEDRTRLTNLETDNTTNKSNITNLQNSLGNKAEKTHNHAISDITNLQTTLDEKLSTNNGLISTENGCIILSNTQGYLGKDKTGATHVIGLIGNDNYCYLGGNLINTYIRSKNCPQYLDPSGNKYNIYHSGNLRVGGVNNIVNGGFTNGTNGYKPNDNTTLTIVDDSASYTGKALKLICPRSNGGIFRWVSSASDSTKTTISFYAKKDSATSSLSITFGFEGIKMANAPLTDKWQRFALTIDAQQGQMLIYTLGAGTFFIHSIKVESGDRYTDWNYANQELVTTKDITVLFERNNGTINKNINTCFNSSEGKFTAPEAGQYLVMCSGYELSNSNMYVACVVGGENSNRNKLYTSGSSGFTLITLSANQTLTIYECPAGNITSACISSNSFVNMLIARIK